MTSKESNLFQDSYDFGHEGEYDDISYGSGVQDSGMPDGYIRVDKNVCRAVYIPISAPKNAPKYICLNKASCRTKYGGQDHLNLRNEPSTRAEPGIYLGIYGQTGKLLAAKADSLTSVETMVQKQSESRASDRIHAAASMEGRSLRPGEEPFSTSDAEADLTAGVGVPYKSRDNSADKDSQLLKLMSTLMNRLDILEGKTATHQSQGQTKPTNPGVLRRGKHRSTTEGDAISSTARKHVEATRNGRWKGVEDEEEGVEEGSVGYVEDEDEEGEDQSDDDSDATPPPKQSKKKKPRKNSSRPRLYAIACGRGGRLALGLYRAQWDEVEFIVSGYPKAKYRKVSSEKEGIGFIRKHLKRSEIGRPKWMKEGKKHYPSISRIRAYLGVDESSEESSSPSSSSDSSTDATPPPKKKRPSSSKHKRMGVDPSMGKDTELFGFDIKNINALEANLAPENLGKKTASLFLEQIDDMAAYPRHSGQKTQESLGDFVEAVTDLNHQQQGQRGGVRDTGWKSKTRNSLDYIKNSHELDVALTYLAEEQHTMMETCQGDLESVLVNAQVDDDTATNVVSNSLALRIGRDTLHSYMSLLNHLSSISSTRGWEACGPHIRYHAEKIGGIRVRYRHRLQMICRMYIYLREGMNKNWMSLKLQSAEISSLRTQLVHGGDSGTQGYNCSHCKSALHGGGKGSCPWKDKGSSDAKKAAATFMVRMASGKVDFPAPSP